jgi:hypothetical protein
VTGLARGEIERFHAEGFLRLPAAFAPEDAAAMAEAWWAELEDTHGIRRDDRTTWRQPSSDLRRAKQDPRQQGMLTERVRGAVDDLLGAGTWSPPRDWGRTIVTFPEPGDWDVPAFCWHWDNPCAPHREALNGLLVVSFIGAVAPRGGGTLILSGSHRLLMRWEAGLGDSVPRGNHAEARERFHRSCPWLMALTGKAPSPPDRTGCFMDEGAIVDGVELRVVELTGEPGDMVLCHPSILHCSAPNRGTEPRFMRIKQRLFTHTGARLAA